MLASRSDRISYGVRNSLTSLMNDTTWVEFSEFMAKVSGLSL